MTLVILVIPVNMENLVNVVILLHLVILVNLVILFMGQLKGLLGFWPHFLNCYDSQVLLLSSFDRK